jgi:hypothetical protein
MTHSGHAAQPTGEVPVAFIFLSTFSGKPNTIVAGATFLSGGYTVPVYRFYIFEKEGHIITQPPTIYELPNDAAALKTALSRFGDTRAKSVVSILVVHAKLPAKSSRMFKPSTSIDRNKRQRQKLGRLGWRPFS